MEQPSGLGRSPNLVIRMLRRLLRPLVRFMLSQGVTYPMLGDLLKSVYVEIAAEEFTLKNKRQTDSRISLLTGVHRKDVKRLVHEPLSREAEDQSSATLGGQLVSRWTGQKAYLDARGRPLPLKRLASDGGARSFEALVASVSKDIRSRAVLDEWLRLGIAHMDDNDRVCLNVDAFVPKQGFEEKAFFFGQNLHDHIAASTHNMLGQGAPFLERSVYYDTLTRESIDELRRMAADLGMQALQEINRKALELEARDAKRADANQRMNFGVYFYNEQQRAEDSEESR
jgi:hypothetical protein